MKIVNSFSQHTYLQLIILIVILNFRNYIHKVYILYRIPIAMFINIAYVILRYGNDTN